MARQQVNPFADLLDNIDTAGLSPDEQTALAAEAQGEAAPPAPLTPDPTLDVTNEPLSVVEPVVEDPVRPPIADAESVVTAPADAPNDPAKPAKPLSPAQERIRELVAERNAAEAAQAEQSKQAGELREKWARLEERQRIAEQIAAQEAQQAQAREHAQHVADERPDPGIDPTGAKLFDAEQRIAMLAAQNEQIIGAMQQFGQQSQAQQQIAALGTYVNQDIALARQRHTDYDAAAKYATESRVKFWQSLGKTEPQARERVQAEALAIAGEAYQEGRSASEVYYDLAKTWGYAPANGNGKPAVPTIVTPKEKLAQVAAGQAVQGLSNVPNASESSSTDVSRLSGADIADMSDEQFLRLNADPKQGPVLRKRLAQLDLG